MDLKNLSNGIANLNSFLFARMLIKNQKLFSCIILANIYRVHHVTHKPNIPKIIFQPIFFYYFSADVSFRPQKRWCQHEIVNSKTHLWGLRSMLGHLWKFSLAVQWFWKGKRKLNLLSRNSQFNPLFFRTEEALNFQSGFGSIIIWQETRVRGLALFVFQLTFAIVKHD